ncbi:MAG TPA: hypothetical protein VNM72_06410 [Blastocatellia bacterium]|nr:hypothetical protein [Blastocatellia bacterium]
MLLTKIVVHPAKANQRHAFSLTISKSLKKRQRPKKEVQGIPRLTQTDEGEADIPKTHRRLLPIPQSLEEPPRFLILPNRLPKGFLRALSAEQHGLRKRALGRHAHPILLACRPQLLYANLVAPFRCSLLKRPHLKLIDPRLLRHMRDDLRPLRPRRTVHLDDLPTVRPKQPHDHINPSLRDDHAHVLPTRQRQPIDVRLAPAHLPLNRRPQDKLPLLLRSLRRLLLSLTPNARTTHRRRPH